MMHWLVSTDTHLFILLNSKLTSSFLDTVMTAITHQGNWYPILGGAWVALMIFGGRRGRLVGVILLVALALSDQICCSLLKPLVGRIRPCNTLPPDQLRLLVRCSHAKSFPSGHATNSFAMATVASWGYRRLAPIFFVIAAIVAYSRVYVGVHYPFDVLGGGVLGFAVGRFAIWLVVRVTTAWKR